MNTVDFVNKVREMRAAQKAYFKNRLQSDLIKSKQLEAEVDLALKEGVTVREFAEPEVMTEEQFQERMAFMNDQALIEQADMIEPEIDA